MFVCGCARGCGEEVKYVCVYVCVCERERQTDIQTETEIDGGRCDHGCVWVYDCICRVRVMA